MKLLNSRIGVVLASVLGMLVCGVASATPVAMDFDAMTPAFFGTSVDTYYDGGCSTVQFFGTHDVDCNGPNDGVVWKNAYVMPFFDNPSAPNYARPGLFSGGTMTMNVAGGFDTGFHFYYTTFLHAFTGTVTAYSGSNGDGAALGHLDLAGTGLYCNGSMPCWMQTGLDFTGNARSVIFDGFGALFGLDDVTIGASLPVGPVAVPEPAALGVFGLGLLMIGAFVGLRRRIS